MRPLKLLASRTGLLLVGLDAGLLAACWAGAITWYVPDTVLAWVLPFLQLAMLHALGLHRRDSVLEVRTALTRLPLAVGLALTTAWMLDQSWAPLAGEAPVLSAETLVLAAAAFAACGTAARLALFAMLRGGLLRRRLMVVGAGQRAAELAGAVAPQGGHLHFDIVFVHDPALGPREPELGRGSGQSVVMASDGNYLRLALAHDVDQIVVAPDERRGMRLEWLLDCKKAGFPVLQYLAFIEREARRVDLRWMELGWLLYSDGFRFRAIDRLLKRALDVAVSLLLLVPGSLAMLAAALAIRWEDGGPVLYAQTRVTQDGRTFRILKLRTMRVDAERGGAVWAASGDSRITRVGRVLRQSRIDELPQLINVLRGEMSLVGPRPERPEFTGDLAERIPLYHERHSVKAGLTGWAQINHPYGASIEDARAKLGYDLYYVKNFSIGFDLLIILQTLRLVLFPSGAR
jgi:sugar transferase (PEP-CTERM system associated)